MLGVGNTGRIVGTIRDPQEAVVAGAAVSVRNLETGAERSVQSNSRGDYVVPLLQPGLYEVTAESVPFTPGKLTGIKLDVDQTARVDLNLDLPKATFQVEATAFSPFLQTETSTVGHIIDRRRVTELPLNERTFLSFTLLVPGVQMPSDGSLTSGDGAGGAISVNGAREQANNFLLDGVDNNDLSVNQYTVLPAIDAIEEFKVQASNSSGEFGRSGGAQINMVLKSGTNDFHGSLYEFFRNRKLDAKNFFDLPDCTADSVPGTCGEIPKFNRNQFGGTVGGPLRRDKTFFFTAYEGLRLRQAVTRQATVPSQNQLEAALAALPPAARNPAGVAALELYPSANAGRNLAESNTFVAAPKARNSGDLALFKLDQLIGADDTLSGHYALFDVDRFDPYAIQLPFSGLPGFGSFQETRGQNVALSWVRVFSPTVLNEARFGFNRRHNGFVQENSGTSKSRELGFPDVSSNQLDWGFPNITIPGFDDLGESIVLPQNSVGNTFHYVDNVVWNPEGSRHQVKFGADVRQFQWNSFLDVFSRGNWFFLGVVTGDPLQDLLLGAPTLAITSQGDSNGGFRTTALNFYLQDDWRVTSNFTLNLAIRYEYNVPVVEVEDRLSVPDFSPNSLTCSPQPDCQFIRAGTGGIPRATYENDPNNFAPRIGFAWAPGVSKRFVLRGAYGIFYDATVLNRNIFPRLNPPFFRIDVLINTGVNSIQDILDQGFALPPQVGMIDPRARDSYVQQWNFGWQGELARNLVLDLSYVGSKGTKLARQIDINQPRPGGAPPFPQFGASRFLTSDVSSSYHSLQLRAERRVARGATFLGAYTWSKSIDNGSGMFGSAAEPDIPQDSFDPAAERGLSNFHTNHRLVFSYLHDFWAGNRPGWLQSGPLAWLLGDWQVGAIAVLQSGRPFTVTRMFDQSGTGTDLAFSDRPDLVADPFEPGPVANHPNPACLQTISLGGRAADRVRDPSSWFNPCAFAAPATVRFGNAGRNALIGPGLINLDFSLLKEIPLRNENHRLQLRFEFFNLANHPNFDIPDRTFDSSTFSAVLSANAFGNKPPRQIQLGLRYVF